MTARCTTCAALVATLALSACVKSREREPIDFERMRRSRDPLDVLEFQRSFVGGVTHKFQEQWDELSCRHCCSEFQYRHRTRKLSRVSAPSSYR